MYDPKGRSYCQCCLELYRRLLSHFFLRSSSSSTPTLQDLTVQQLPPQDSGGLRKLGFSLMNKEGAECSATQPCWSRMGERKGKGEGGSGGGEEISAGEGKLAHWSCCVPSLHCRGPAGVGQGQLLPSPYPRHTCPELRRLPGKGWRPGHSYAYHVYT